MGVGDDAHYDANLMDAAAVYKAANGKLSQSLIAERFGVSVSALRRAVRATPAPPIADQGLPVTEEYAAGAGQNEREVAKEKRERWSDRRSWIALGLSVAFSVFGVWTGCRTNAIDDRNRQLADRVESASDPARVVAADHRETLYVRNGSPRPMLDVKAVSVQIDDEGRETPQFQIKIGEINGCADTPVSVSPDIQRKWGREDPESPQWVLIWTDVGGKEWELASFASDSAGDTPDVPYEGAYNPEPTATSATRDLSNVAIRTGMSLGASVTLAKCQ